MRRFSHVVLLVLSVLALPRAGGAEVQGFGPFRYSPDLPGILVLSDFIGKDAVAEFDRALAAHPGIRTLFLESRGGIVQTALDLSERVHALGISTVVPHDADCASACAFLFVAGLDRRVYGRLGVHQFSSNGQQKGADAEGNAQALTARILETLGRYGVPTFLVVKALQTPHDEIYWFTPEELQAHGIETQANFLEDVAAYAALPDLSKPVDLLSFPTASVPPDRVPDPSFDCAKARTDTEKTLCSDADLANLDTMMAKRYVSRRAALTGAAREAFVQSQRDWLQQRNACGADKDCLFALYGERIFSLIK